MHLDYIVFVTHIYKEMCRHQSTSLDYLSIPVEQYDRSCHVEWLDIDGLAHQYYNLIFQQLQGCPHYTDNYYLIILQFMFHYSLHFICTADSLLQMTLEWLLTFNFLFAKMYESLCKYIESITRIIKLPSVYSQFTNARKLRNMSMSQDMKTVKCT